MTSHEQRRTALYEQHMQAGAKLISFAGWQLPAFYTSVLDEHRCVRERVGVFDVSHMGEFIVQGADAAAFLQKMTINDVRRLSPGESQYTAFCTPAGGVVDDLLVYHLAEERYLLCVNAANREHDYRWLKEHAGAFSQLTLTDESGVWSQIAIQGPASLEALAGVFAGDLYGKIKALAYTHILELTHQGKTCYIARTGYTGEKGYELYLPNELAESVWKALLATKEQTGLQAIGLGARDTLRLEAGYALHGNELSEEISPLEGGIAWAVKLDGEDFVGRDALRAQQQGGVKRRSYCFRLDEQGIARAGMEVYVGEQLIGVVTSGSVLPSVGGAGGMALLSSNSVKVGDTVTIKVRNSMKQAQIVKRPLYAARTKD